MTVVSFSLKKRKFFFGKTELSIDQVHSLYKVGLHHATRMRFGSSSSSGSDEYDENVCAICMQEEITDKSHWSCQEGREHKFCQECTDKILNARDFSINCPLCKAWPRDTQYYERAARSERVEDGEGDIFDDELAEAELATAQRNKWDRRRSLLGLATIGAMALAPTQSTGVLAPRNPFDDPTKPVYYTSRTPYDWQRPSPAHWPKSQAVTEYEPEKGKGRARSRLTKELEKVRKDYKLYEARVSSQREKDLRKIRNHFKRNERQRKQAGCRWYQNPKDTYGQIAESGGWACPNPLRTPMHGIVEY